MATCKRCGEKTIGHHECTYCANTYCPDHRLPENHDCSGVRGWETRGGRFEGGFDDSR